MKAISARSAGKDSPRPAASASWPSVRLERRQNVMSLVARAGRSAWSLSVARTASKRTVVVILRKT